MLRAPADAPCLRDPDSFDCADCEIGWTPRCRLRTDDELRAEGAALWRTHHHVPNLDPHLSGQIERVSLALLQRQGIAVPARLIHSYLPAWMQEECTLDSLTSILRWSQSSWEATPGMFRYVRGDARSIWTGFRSSTGAMLSSLLFAHPAPNGRTQTGQLKRLAALAIARRYADRVDASAALEAAVVKLLPLVADEGWTVTDLADVAVGRAQLPQRLLNAPSPERTRLLGGILAVELLRKRNSASIAAEFTTLNDEILTSNVRLVAHEARRYATGEFMHMGDLFQEGFLGLMRALEKFDAYRGFAFSTYATPWIRQKIRRAIADQGRTIRFPVHTVDKLNAIRSARVRLGRGAIPEAIAASCGLTVDEVRQINRWAQPVLPLTSPLTDRMGQVALENAIDAIEWQATLTRHVNDLVVAQRRVLSLRYGLTDGVSRTLAEVGIELHVTRERVRQVERKALDRLREELVREVPPPRGRTKRKRKVSARRTQVPRRYLRAEDLYPPPSGAAARE